MRKTVEMQVTKSGHCKTMSSRGTRMNIPNSQVIAGYRFRKLLAGGPASNRAGRRQ